MPQIMIAPDFGGLTCVEISAQVIKTTAEARGRVAQQVQLWTAPAADRWDEEQMRARRALANKVIL